MIISDAEKRTIAYHEAGHALVAGLPPGRRPLHKGADHPARPRAGPHHAAAVDDKYNYSRDYLINRITIPDGRPDRRGDRAAAATTGAGRRPLRRPPRDGAQDGVASGLSDKLGRHLSARTRTYLPRPGGRARKDYSEETALAIDGEIKRIVLECATRARQTSRRTSRKLHALARRLLERESLDSEEIARILRRVRSPKLRRRLGKWGARKRPASLLNVGGHEMAPHPPPLSFVRRGSSRDGHGVRGPLLPPLTVSTLRRRRRRCSAMPRWMGPAGVALASSRRCSGSCSCATSLGARRKPR